MRAFAVTLLALYLSVGAAAAQTNEQMIWAMGEVGEELCKCAPSILQSSRVASSNKSPISPKNISKGPRGSGFWERLARRDRLRSSNPNLRSN